MRTEQNLLYPLLLVLVTAALFIFGAPTDNAFSWPDSPRHALNGAFVLDLLRDLPFKHAMSYAYDYYAKYPALTILFYPPLFYVFLAPFYAVFGVSQASALVAEFVCYAMLAWGSYRFARFWLEPTAAFGAALILISAPEVAFWGRQVMLEIPAFALMVWSAVFFMRHLREGRTLWLYLAVALMVLAMYTKLSAAFIALAYFVLLLRYRGMALFRDRHSYIVAGLAVLAVIPLIVLTLKFGQANVQSVSGIADSKVSRASLAGWLWYAQQMPGQIGWPTLIAAIAGLGVVLTKRERARALALPLLWLAIGYVFFSAIDLKEARHSLLLLLPLGVLASAGIMTLLRKKPRIAGIAVIGLGVVTLGITVFTRPVLYVAGYTEVADFIASNAPKNSNVVFSGYRDGSFIFAMRTHAERHDLSTIRADKLFLNVAVRRGLGVQVKEVDESEIGPMLDRLGVQYVVAQPGFWADLESMRRFENVLKTDHFEPVRRFTMPSNYDAQEKELVVYRNLGHVAPGPVHLDIEIPAVGRVVSGSVGGAN